MKYFLLFLFNGVIAVKVPAQFVTNVYRTEQSGMDLNDIIYYNPAKSLVWKDFKGDPVEGGPVAAITSSGFGYKADMKTSGGKGQINVAVYCYFSKGKSWVKPGRTTPYILNHEQHHFDASYLASTLFMEKVKAILLTPANCNTVLPRLYRECCDMMNKLQNDYDGQTKNGQLPEIQEKWNGFFMQRIPLLTK